MVQSEQGFRNGVFVLNFYKPILLFKKLHFFHQNIAIENEWEAHDLKVGRPYATSGYNYNLYHKKTFQCS